MPAISKIRLTNVVYEDGDKRFNDEVFKFDGHNAAILLENGGGKTVFIHTVLQAILPHTPLGERKIKETLQLENAPAHIGIEWILNERPRRYMTTVVSLFLYNNQLDSYRFVYEYEHNDPDELEQMPFVRETAHGMRPAYKEEMAEYFSAMKQKSYNAQTFDTLHKFHQHLENNYKIIKNEWESIVKINRDEGGIEKFFENCRTTTDLYDRLLIPTVEDSIANHKEGIFADMFEQHREGFKRYRDLQKSMAEHRAIQAELQKYVAEYADYSQRETAYHSVKERAKGLLETIQQQLGKMKQELAENHDDWEKWRIEQTLYDRQKASFAILQERHKEQALEADFLEKQTQLEEALEKFHENEQLFHHLKYAKWKQELATHEELRKQYREELDDYDAESDVADLEATLEDVTAKLHGKFLTQIEELEKIIANVVLEKRPLEEAKEKCTKELTVVEEKLRTEEDVYHQTVGKIASKQDELDRLKQALLAHPEQENVHEVFEKWTTRQQFLDEEMIELKQQKKRNEHRVEALGEEREEKRAARNDFIVQIREQERNLEEIETAHAAIIEQLATVRATWKGIDDLHLKEGSVRGPLEELEKRLVREREELLLKERIARRFVDDYGEQESFFADAFLQERLDNWQNQIFVVTGPTFVADLREAEKEVYAGYPLWPLTLVTTEADKEKLREKLIEVEDRLQFPILILTLEEAKEIGVAAGDSHQTWVAPKHWQTNLEAATFVAWKENVTEKATETTNLRVEKEAELAHCREVKAIFEQFFTKYPKEKKEAVQETLRDLISEREMAERTLSKLTASIEQLKREIRTTEERIEKAVGEKAGIDRLIEKASEFFQVERDVEGLTKKRTEIERNRDELAKEKAKWKRQLRRYEEEIDEKERQIADNQTQLKILTLNELFQKVKNVVPVYSDESRDVLENRRDDLLLQIRGVRQQYGEIQTKLEQAERDIERVTQEMAAYVKMYDIIDTEMDFPVDGESALARAQENVREGKALTAKLSAIADDAKSKFSEQKVRVETIVEQFETRDFPGEEIFTFDMDVEAIETFLLTTKRKLTERKTYLEAETKRIESELHSIEQAERQLESYEVAHQFNRSIVTATSLTEKEMTEFTYGREQFVQKMTEELTAKQSELAEGKEKIDAVKTRFRTFCRNHITERKLREMAMNGIEVKNTYEDVLAFQHNMVTAVERADSYARDFISKQDKEVQAFINNIHNHLVNVTDQLRIIPRNTRVKVGDKMREIFKFTIPEWKEEDGKTRIRNHMDWILEQLESDFFKNEQGLEDSTKVRKEIETWLDTKQLLQVVMEQQALKVSCRKVTNDNQVSSRLTSWEQSNQWSGGEKWSKNMTLFLGILNFVAEKKQHLDGKMKRHRAVILDNPFGKASSDHVLSPVFFIAEQLGFQIIALTAHADGKFLQDYFPIIYSLKLRPTRDAAKQVMTKEKSLHHAYFRDHDPVVMERLEEREQLELF